MNTSPYSTIFNVTEFGAIPDGITSCSHAFALAIASCSKAGGGSVYVPAGTFLTGSIMLKSNINLNLDSGAILIFTNDIAQYPIVDSRWEGAAQSVFSSCVYAQNEENISITGRGKLDGQGAFWWKIFKNKTNIYPRPKLISFHNCNNVLIEGVTLINSPSWTINPICCDNVTIDKITIKNPNDSPNTDGINPESCKNVHISNCHIDVGDDCITIKSGTEATPLRVPCENITITNCTMVHGHGGVVIGSEMSGDVRCVTISNCVFEGTDRGIRMKSRRGRGGVIEDIRINNIVMKDVLCPFIANLYYYCGPNGKDKYVWDKAPYPITVETPAFRRIHFSNITAREVRAAAGFFYGLPEMYVEDVSFNNISISMAENAEPGMPDMMANLAPMKQRGFFCSNVKDIFFNNVTISNNEGPAFYVENSINVEFSRCKTKDAKGNDPMVKLNNVI
ncbi:glycoside hydrolase family 28 protein [Clostridium estertheticum]|uniref:Endopolygalacturonase n=1 Tax=Clostridium estertheticum subsp. estertheticum TaxID=1552 RepID=A0A1J0GDX9_9CLOT|nr:glycoside hydrolase family 28 protein [Clostridium estertheticum]APC39525.1 endopolygalacturonase [Clostridium estertheticum subsp. estertheticum]MBZ9614446.1 glycoside hydrolase family 28 protein [Clostridium estertheticum subsp. laramiense]WAG74377.1 glycoside hydrolase family 28 protein [Clostridium estertheticum]